MIFYNTENPRDKMNKYAKRSRAENPPNIAGSLQINGAWRLRGHNNKELQWKFLS
jgi:hypothetical protein